MPHVRGEIFIDRPPADVFDFVSDERNEPTFNPSMTSVTLLTDPPIAQGSRFAATIVSRGRTVPMRVELTEFNPPTQLGSKSTVPGMTMTGHLTFRAADGGTRMMWDWDVRPTGLARLATTLIALVGRRQERRIWSSLKHHLEAE